MKHTIAILAFFTALLALAGCNKDKELKHLNVSPVTTLYGPNDQAFVKLQPSTSAAVDFEWEQSRAEDGGVVIYEIAFDTEAGDFSKPIYKMPSNNNGLYNKATLTHKVLNRIAALAGIGSRQTGKLKWTVYASKGINAQKATESRVLELERPAGFEAPVDAYLTGTATEGGDDLSKAVKMKMIANGVFEAFTSLRAGSYQVADRNQGTPTVYHVEGSELKENGATTQNKAGVYRIVIDFNNAAVTLTEIIKFDLYFAPDNKVLGTLAYSGAGKFLGQNIPVTFKQESWGRDERYKFKVTVKNADGTDGMIYFNSSSRDNSRPTNTTPASYYYLTENGDTSQWDYTFKFATEVDGKNIDVTADFSPSLEQYTHTIVIK